MKSLVLIADHGGGVVQELYLPAATHWPVCVGRAAPEATDTDFVFEKDAQKDFSRRQLEIERAGQDYAIVNHGRPLIVAGGQAVLDANQRLTVTDGLALLAGASRLTVRLVAARPPTHVLEVETKGRTRAYRFHRTQQVRIGANRERNDWVVDGQFGVSRRHFRLAVSDQADRVALDDLGSKNGVCVLESDGGKPVRVEGRAEVPFGRRFIFGSACGMVRELKAVERIPRSVFVAGVAALALAVFIGAQGVVSNGCVTQPRTNTVVSVVSLQQTWAKAVVSPLDQAETILAAYASAHSTGPTAVAAGQLHQFVQCGIDLDAANRLLVRQLGDMRARIHRQPWAAASYEPVPVVFDRLAECRRAWSSNSADCAASAEVKAEGVDTTRYASRIEAGADVERTWSRAVLVTNALARARDFLAAWQDAPFAIPEDGRADWRATIDILAEDDATRQTLRKCLNEAWEWRMSISRTLEALLAVLATRLENQPAAADLPAAYPAQPPGLPDALAGPVVRAAPAASFERLRVLAAQAPANDAAWMVWTRALDTELAPWTNVTVAAVRLRVETQRRLREIQARLERECGVASDRLEDAIRRDTPADILAALPVASQRELFRGCAELPQSARLDKACEKALVVVRRHCEALYAEGETVRIVDPGRAQACAVQAAAWLAALRATFDTAALPPEWMGKIETWAQRAARPAAEGTR